MNPREVQLGFWFLTWIFYICALDNVCLSELVKSQLTRYANGSCNAAVTPFQVHQKVKLTTLSIYVPPQLHTHTQFSFSHKVEDHWLSVSGCVQRFFALLVVTCWLTISQTNWSVCLCQTDHQQHWTHSTHTESNPLVGYADEQDNCCDVKKQHKPGGVSKDYALTVEWCNVSKPNIYIWRYRQHRDTSIGSQNFRTR